MVDNESKSSLRIPNAYPCPKGSLVQPRLKVLVSKSLSREVDSLTRVDPGIPELKPSDLEMRGCRSRCNELQLL
jgi:hypothetical protein